MFQANINTFSVTGETAGLRINISKTRTLVFRSETLRSR